MNLEVNVVGVHTVLSVFWCFLNNDTVAIYRKPDQNIPRPLPLHFESSLPWGQRKCSPAHPGACGHPAGASVVEVRVLFSAGFADKSHHFLLIPYRKLLIIAEALAVWSWPPNCPKHPGGCWWLLVAVGRSCSAYHLYGSWWILTVLTGHRLLRRMNGKDLRPCRGWSACSCK